MSLREFGETTIIYLAGVGSEPLQRRNKSLNFGARISPQNQRHPPDPTARKEIAMAKANYIDYIDVRPGDPTNSEEEPGQIPLSIQSHGAAIVIKEPELTILQVSANTGP